MKAEKRIPVTVLTGYLGSGKTTLLNRLLNARQGKNIFVLMNEYGEIDIDGQLLLRTKEQLVEFNNGCLCCTVRQDLVRMLQDLGERSECDGVIIETTGLADPAPIASTFFVIPEISEKYTLDSIITVVDAYNVGDSLRDSHEAVEQISFADVLVLNKIDTIEQTVKEETEQTLRGLNPLATIYSTINCNVDSEKLLDINAFHMDVKLKVDPTFLDDLPHSHDNSITSLVLTEDERPIDVQFFQGYIASILNQKTMEILRSKGIFYSAKSEERKVVLQTVRMLTAMEEGQPWGEGETKRSEYVVIGRNIDKTELQRVLRLSCRRKHKV